MDSLLEIIHLIFCCCGFLRFFIGFLATCHALKMNFLLLCCRCRIFMPVSYALCYIRYWSLNFLKQYWIQSYLIFQSHCSSFFFVLLTGKIIISFSLRCALFSARRNSYNSILIHSVSEALCFFSTVSPSAISPYFVIFSQQYFGFVLVFCSCLGSSLPKFPSKLNLFCFCGQRVLSYCSR